MESSYTIADLLRSDFPFFSEPELKQEILEHAHLKTLPAGTLIVEAGGFIPMVPLVISGSIKVVRQDPDGREIFLYYLQAGDTCAMTLNCCMREGTSGVTATAEEDTLVLAVPPQRMESWMWKYQSWKAFIMQTFQRRFDELLRTIDNIAFKKMDARLLQYLREKSELKQQPVLHTTHQEIADDLNTSREVISRLLKQLSRVGQVRLGRNEIELLAG